MILIFTMFASVLMLNLLIALMASTYETRRENNAKDMNFAKLEELDRSLRDIQWINAPGNLIAAVVWVFIEMARHIVICGSCGKKQFGITELLPFRIDFNETASTVSLRGSTGAFGSIDARSTALGPKYEYMGRGRKYCRYCRNGMGNNGDINKYLKMITKYRLEKDDVAMIKRLLADTGICDKCYRPYKKYPNGESNRLSRSEIQLEVASFWVFMVVWLFMVVLLAPFALVSGLVHYVEVLKRYSRIHYKAHNK